MYTDDQFWYLTPLQFMTQYDIYTTLEKAKRGENRPEVRKAKNANLPWWEQDFVPIDKI